MGFVSPLRAAAVLGALAMGEALTGGTLLALPAAPLALGEETAEREGGEKGVEGFCGEAAAASGVAGADVGAAPREPAGERDD